MPITYNPSTNIITVTGFSSSDPCTFEDIYQADVNNGWGVVSKQEEQYIINCGLVIGDGTTSTWFFDSEKQALFKVANVPIEGTTRYKATCLVKSYANMKLGLEYDITNRIGWKGCHLKLDVSDAFGLIAQGSGNLYLYNCCLHASHAYGNGSNSWGGHNGQLVVWDSTINGGLYIATPHHDLNRATPHHEGHGNGYLVSLSSVTIDNPRVFGCYGTYNGAFVFFKGSGISVTVKNSYARNNQHFIVEWGVYGYGNRYFINADTDTWEILWTAKSDSIIYRQYTFDLQCLKKDGSGYSGLSVKIYDVDGNLVVDTLTDSEGKIPQQVITYGYYDYDNRPNIVLKTPHRIKIYEGENLIYTGLVKIDRKIFMILTLPFDLVNFKGIVKQANRFVTSSTVKIRFVSSPGDVVKIYVYKPDGSVVINGVTMLETSISGVYEYDVTFDSAWGVGDFLIRCIDETILAEDFYTVHILSEDDWFATHSDIENIKEKIIRILGLVQENFKLYDCIYDTNGNLIEGKIKIYETSNDLENDINPIAIYQISAQYDDNGNCTKYKVIKIS